MKGLFLPMLASTAIYLFAVPAPAQAPPVGDRGAILQPGDAVRITVWRRPEMSGEFVVSVDGTIKHPLYQHVKVAGVQLATAQARLFELLSRYQSNPEVVVEPLFRVAVGGEVREPNLYSFPLETTISQAVALAGGPTENGRLDRVRLLRGSRELVGDLTRVDTEWARIRVQSGDQIIVPRRRAFFSDFVGPLGSLIAAVAGVIVIVRQ